MGTVWISSFAIGFKIKIYMIGIYNVVGRLDGGEIVVPNGHGLSFYSVISV
jgi:hypothetical protein